MSRSLAARMVALLVVVALGTFYIFIDVLGYRVGAQRFGVTAQAPTAGGIYKGAVVTYRGVPVGVVGSLGLRTTGVDIHLSIDPGTRVPADAVAHVRELSALGEQYLDLVPPAGGAGDGAGGGGGGAGGGGGGVFLRAGSVIPPERVVVPVPIGTALLDLGTLLRSVDPGDVRTVETFLVQGFIGTGPALRTIITTGQALFHALVAAQAETQNLIVDGQPVLQTLQATDGQFATFTAGLDQITAQLAASSQDLAALVANGQAAEAQLNPFLGANDANIEATIASLGTAAGVAQQYQPSVRDFFAVLPVVSGQLGSVAAGGQVNGLLTINTANTVCPYLPADLFPLPTQPVAAPALTNGCPTRAPDLLQRGAATVPGG